MAILAVLALLVFQIFVPARSSMVNATGGGYDDIIIAIHPTVPEDAALIESIKQMIKEASQDLYHASQKRLFIKSLKILIPPTWPKRETYLTRGREQYEKADVIVAKTFLNIGDSPYTKQYGGCGKPGQYIHLTPNFLLNEDLSSGYGPRGKVFVHEWAHLRWGVFEEHNTEQPFYISGNLQVEATRCALNVSGLYRVSQVSTDSCSSKPCTFDPDTGVYGNGCVFFPERDQTSTQSLMYYPGLHSISSFCTEDTHNMEAPNMQNRMCNCRSTWDVIKDSDDIIKNPPRNDDRLPEPVFSLLHYRERVITLLIDVSGSMATNNRIQRVVHAADIFLTDIAAGVHVGIVACSSSPYPISNLIQIRSDDDRQKLKDALPITIDTTTSAHFCSGINEAFQVNRNLFGSLLGTEIVFIVDGIDLVFTGCFSDIRDSGVIIHTIALSTEADPKLEEVADMTGGLKYFASDNLSNDLIDAFIGIANANGETTPRINQIESRSLMVGAGDCFGGTVVIDSTVGTDTSFTVTWQSDNPSIHLEDPKGSSYSFNTSQESRLSRMKLAKADMRGNWSYTICNDVTPSQALGLVVTSKATLPKPPISVEVHMNWDTNINPNPMVVYATVSQGLIPVKGAKVTAVISPESGTPILLDLLDNGAGADIAKDDGIYSRYFFNFPEKGRYSVKVRVEGREGRCWLTYPRGRALHIQGFVENGKVVMTPFKQKHDEALPALKQFTRTSSGSSFKLSDLNINPNYPPAKITDLEVRIMDDLVALSWTATGDQLDQGTALEYELRMNMNIKDLRDNFEGSTKVDMPGLLPSLAGTRETVEFDPSPHTERGTVVYFALIAVGHNSKKSELSNIAQVALLSPKSTAQPITVCSTPKPKTCTTIKYVQECSTASPKPVKCPPKPSPKCPSPSKTTSDPLIQTLP